ncbi:hypothetical protein OESDEN_10754 [Oesophagostomum dentatum]|uniref:Uncharacterized protein n=1 Tax=Oesophagostomum dentatum TaxID=61180 RepID=A0A0B1SWR6_OESDE|nr:hypothetical protein OESDEN_10754 [Oesophagostomum dentatum]
MAVEDEGMEPEFDVPESKKKKVKKSLGLSQEGSQNGEAAEVKANALKKHKKHKKKLANAPSPDITGETPSEMVTQAKKELKRKIAETETVSPESTEIPKKKKKLMKTPSATVQPVTPLVTKKKKKKLLKKKLAEGVPVEDVAGKSLKELIASKPSETQTENGDGAKESLKKEKKKKRKQEKPSEPTAPSKKLVLSSSQPPVPARQKITEDVTAGKLEEDEVMTVLRLWRQQKRRRIQTENKEKLLQMDGTLEEIKKAVSDLVRKGKLKPKDAGDIIKRWKAREKRRVDRQISKQT